MAKKSYPKKFITKMECRGKRKKGQRVIVRCAEIPGLLETERTSGSCGSSAVGKKILKEINLHLKNCSYCKKRNEHSLDKV